MALLIALLVLAIAGVVLAAQRRRAREHRLHLSALREREEKLRLALWASDELYWQYDPPRRELESTRVVPGRDGDLQPHVRITRTTRSIPTTCRWSSNAFAGPRAASRRCSCRITACATAAAHGPGCGRADARCNAMTMADHPRIAGIARDVNEAMPAPASTGSRRKSCTPWPRRCSGHRRRLPFRHRQPAFTRMSGYEAAEVAGQDASLLNSSQHDAAFYAKPACGQEGGWSGKCGRSAATGTSLLRDAGHRDPGARWPAPPAFVLVASDITDRRRIEQELRLPSPTTTPDQPAEPHPAVGACRARSCQGRREGHRRPCCSST